MTASATTSLTPALAHDPAFAQESRVWVYTTNRPLSDVETAAVRQTLDLFTRQWTAHNQALQAKAEVFQHQFVILMVDETRAGASGCSIDKSVHFLEQLGKELGVDFFERMRFAWADENGTIHFVNRPELSAARQSGVVSDQTPMLNTLVQNRQELLEKWMVPFRESWHRRVV